MQIYILFHAPEQCHEAIRMKMAIQIMLSIGTGSFC